MTLNPAHQRDGGVVALGNVDVLGGRAGLHAARRVAQAQRLLVEELAQALDGEDAQGAFGHSHDALGALIAAERCTHGGGGWVEGAFERAPPWGLARG